MEYACMSSPVTRLSLAAPRPELCGATVEQGCVCIFELKDRSERYQRGAAEKSDVIGFTDWADEALVTRAEFELKKMNYAEKIKEVTGKFV